MTAKQIFEQEENNTNTIILHREAIFWKAYEKSAYSLCKFIHPFKVKCRVIKSESSKLMCSVGFPVSTAEKYVSSLPILAVSNTAIILSSPEPILVSDYEEWKHHQLPAVIGLGKNQLSVEEEIRKFTLEDHTPIECMMFIKMLKDGFIQ